MKDNTIFNEERIRVIYKYPLLVQDIQTLDLHYDRKIIHIDVQNGVPCLWVLHDIESEIYNVKIATYPTGVEIDLNKNVYIGTYQLNGFVWHLFFTR